MIQYDRSKPLINLHIPKCGGRSFQVILQKWFGKNYYKHYVIESKGKKPVKHRLTQWWKREQFKAGLCIDGHFNKERGFGAQDYYPEVEQFITIIRDPLEMMLSNYFFGKKKEAKKRNFRGGKRFNFTELYPDINTYLREHPLYLMYHMPREMTLENYREVLDKHFIYIGITEDMQTSVDNMAKKLGFASMAVEHRNASPRDEGVSYDVRAQYRADHPLEYAIYDYAVATYKNV